MSAIDKSKMDKYVDGKLVKEGKKDALLHGLLAFFKNLF